MTILFEGEFRFPRKKYKATLQENCHLGWSVPSEKGGKNRTSAAKAVYLRIIYGTTEVVP
jgi:hypothetical protein